jgi:hypothetical protein
VTQCVYGIYEAVAAWLNQLCLQDSFVIICVYPPKVCHIINLISKDCSLFEHKRHVKRYTAPADKFLRTIQFGCLTPRLYLVLCQIFLILYNKLFYQNNNLNSRDLFLALIRTILVNLCIFTQNNSCKPHCKHNRNVLDQF